MMDQPPAGYRYFHIIAMLFVTTLIVTNTIAIKIFTFWGIIVPAGVITFPLSYLSSDILTEVYGFRKTCSLIWWGFFCMAGMSLFYWLASLLPPAECFAENNPAFATFFHLVPRLALASLLAYLLGEFLNSMVISFLKVQMDGRYFGLRAILSTLIGQGTDSFLFNFIAFGGLFPLRTVAALAFYGFLIKTAYELCVLPITCMIVPRLKRAEGMDVYDYNISYNPFRAP